ncbi:MAG: hypothetical protein CL545_10080 [Alcanivorax sp.]|nr:hypothetical protein [Alcanivorax sp.]
MDYLSVLFKDRGSHAADTEALYCILVRSLYKTLKHFISEMWAILAVFVHRQLMLKSQKNSHVKNRQNSGFHTIRRSHQIFIELSKRTRALLFR